MVRRSVTVVWWVWWVWWCVRACVPVCVALLGEQVAGACEGTCDAPPAAAGRGGVLLDCCWSQPTFNRFDDFIACPGPSPPVDTVTSGMLTGVFVVLPIALITVIDGAFTVQRIRSGSIPANQRLASVLGVVYRWLVVIAGGAVQVCITAVAKSAVAEYRPDFLAQCNLNTTGLPASQAWVPITRCMGEARWIADGRRAFFSGHASSSFFYMVYFSVCGVRTSACFAPEP